MNAACQLCKGACCEGMRLSAHPTEDPDANRWFSFHGEAEGRYIYLKTPCRHLDHGLCMIYEDRPDVCRVAKVGGDDCVRAIHRNRPEIAKEIEARF